jgi:predicted permease
VRLRVLASRIRPRRPDPAFDDEIRAHLNLLADRYIRRGMSAADAHAAARRQFGNQTLLHEDRSDMQTFAPLENLLRDLRHGVRVLARTPGFAVVAFLTLALGIGANTAIFSMVEALLLRPLPFPGASRIVVPATIFQRSNSDTGSVAYADILDWKAQRDLFESVSAYMRGQDGVTGPFEPERVASLSVDEEYFRVMGAPLLLGRVPTAEENHLGAHRVVVLSYVYWMRRFGGDPAAVGSALEIGGTAYRILGVARKDMTWPSDAAIIRPLAVDQFPEHDRLRRDNHIFQTLARLQPGVTVEQAQTRLTAMGGRLAQDLVTRRGTNWKLHRLRDYIVGRTLRQTLLVLFAAALLVLLIACVNVANLMLARASVRAREVAIRNALGAGWKRLASQFLAEGAALAGAGGVAGMAIGYGGLRALVRFAPADVPMLGEARIDIVVLAFTLLLCFVAALVAGAAPAIHAARRDPALSLNMTARGSSSGASATRLRSLLVVSEIALALILLAGAGLLIRSFQQLQHVDPGFPTRNLLTLRLALPPSRYPGRAGAVRGFDQVAGAIRAVPGVLSVAAAGSLPIDGGGFYLGRAFLREGQPEPPATTDAHALWNPVQSGFFETLGIPVVLGRGFNDRDTAESTPAIIISQKLAREMFPGQNPLGRRIRSWRDENVYREIVGVVGDVHYDELSEAPPGLVYVPYPQSAWGQLMVCIRTAAEPSAITHSVREAIWSIDRKLSISDVKTMDEIVDSSLARLRFSMFLLTIFGSVARLLAAIGIYGVVAYSVTQRTREIGIRIALGAARRDVLRMVARGALTLAAAGIVAGIAGALALTRLMVTLLYGVSPSDARTFSIVAVVLLFVTLASAFFPARRAAKVDPIVTLRYE